jgi:hypothetical protein
VKTVVFVGCGKAKLDRKAPAKDLYTSTLFKKCRAYAERYGDEWAILSARYRLVMPDQVIEPYDVCLDDYDRVGLQGWVHLTQYEIVARWPSETTKYVCLGGALYSLAFTGYPRHLQVELPMCHLGMGERLQFLTRENARAWNDARNAESVPGVAPRALKGEVS